MRARARWCGSGRSSWSSGASAGGLGLTTDQFGTIYGTFGTVAFIAGSVLGGYFTSWLGLRRALLPLICVMNLPNLAYVYLSTALPTNPVLIAAALSLEMFGYGFGFVGVILLMMQEIAPGKYQTAHYAFANSLMNLGLMIPGTVSGKIQMAVGYRMFFVWVLLSSIPALIMARFLRCAAEATNRAGTEPRQSTEVNLCVTAISITTIANTSVSQVDVPVSWTNYLGVRDLCTVISHNAGGYSFYRSAGAPAHHALSPERRSARPARSLCLSARRPDRRVLVRFPGSRWARICSRHFTNAGTAFLLPIFLRLPRSARRADPVHSAR